MRHPRTLLAASLAVAMALTTAACNSASDDQPGIQPGGTLRIAAPSLPANLDPQRIAAALEANISRVITRTLTTFKAEPGTASGELVADLATDLGRPRDNNKVWSFKLKDGLKWADGSPITCQHLKYGAERNFATIAKNNLPYARTYLEDNPKPYDGPFKGVNPGLNSVVCLDTKTIEYHLKFPVGDFNYSVALAVFAPVKQGADSDDEQFNLEPLASGPYKVKAGRTEKDTEMTLVRNEHWSAATDKVRKAYPDQIIISAAQTNVPALTNSIIEDEGNAKDTVMLMDVSANFVQQVMTDPALSARTASGPSGLVRYLSINTKKIPNEKCRQALLWAFNKRKFRQAMGGSLIGDLATTMLSPTLKAYQKFDHYGVFTNGGEGNPQRALELIAKANQEDHVTCPTKLVLAHPDQPTTTNRFVKTVVDAFIEIGVQVQLQPLPVGPYFNTIKAYEAQSKYDLLWAGWIPDWSNGSAVIPPLFGSDAVAKEPGVIGGSNTSFLEDPEIDKAILDANLETSLERQWKAWGEIDSKLQQKAVSIPIIYGKAIRLHGSNVGGAYIHSALGMPDIASLGLIHPGGAAAQP